MKVDMRKIYRFDPVPVAAGEPLPVGGNVYYECSACKEVVVSVPHIMVKCGCGNLEGKGGKLTVKDPGQVTPMKGSLR